MPVDDRERAVIDLWRKGHLSSGTIQIYLQWVRRFRAFCEMRQLDEVEQLTREGVRQFVRLLRRTQARETSQRAEQQRTCAQRSARVVLRIARAGGGAAAMASQE
jgi:site-specific recombinase XerD